MPPTSSAGTFGASDIGGTRSPDLVACSASTRLGVSSRHRSPRMTTTLATTRSRGALGIGTEAAGHPGDKWGWAVQGALQIKNIPTGAGDTINIQGVYTEGASRYNFQDLMATSYTMFGGTGVPGAYQSVGLGLVTDAVFVTGGEHATDQDLWFPRCLHPQLGSILEHRPLRCLGCRSL